MNKTKTIKINYKKIFISLIFLFFSITAVIIFINFFIIKSTEKQIENTPKDKEYDCILVLGAGVRNGSPSPMLKDRLDYAIDLYKNNAAPKIIMSGDHSTKDYDEVNIMKSYAVENGVKAEDVFMDHAGFSTYESIYRAKEVFLVKKMIIVTQKYHIYRALYIANSFDVEAIGVTSDPRKYAGQTYRDLREILARNKDYLYCIFKPSPKYLGPSIAVSGDGNQTNG